MDVIRERWSHLARLFLVCFVLGASFLWGAYNTVGSGIGFPLELVGVFFLSITTILWWYIFEPFWTWLFDRILERSARK